MISQLVANLLFIIFLCLNRGADVSTLNMDVDIAATDKLKFGLNEPQIQTDFLEIVSDTVNYAQFFKDYHIQYLRFPGGSTGRYFIYNSNALSIEAKNKVWEYYQSRGKLRAADKTPEEFMGRFSMPDNYYELFLKFCLKNGIKPICGLNTCFYSYGNKLYQVAPFVTNSNNSGNDKETQPNGLNDKLKKALTDQINLTHKYFTNVTWEIGNEENYMYTGVTEAKIVQFYSDVIKSLYPQDKVIASFVNTFETTKKNKDKFAREYINELSRMKVLPQIDYFAPHFYINAEDQVKTDEEIKKKLQEINFAGFEKTEISYFPSGYTPHFFITEFQVFQGAPSRNVNVNSNLHALLMFYYLMNFYGSTYIDGVIYHSFLGKGPFVFLKQEPAAFNDSITNKNSGYKKIAVIPLQAQAVKIFFDNVGEAFVNLIREGDLTILITQSGGKNIYFFSNTSARDVTIDKRKIISELHDNADLSFTNYIFQALNSKSNIPVYQIKKEKYQDFNSLEIKKYSVLIVK